MKDGGGPAFPIPTGAGDDGERWRRGMSLRDYFAGQALAGIAGNMNTNTATHHAGHFAAQAWALADAMLAQRKKED